MKISLLSALPHSLSDVRRAHGNVSKDYVHGILRGFQVSPENIWAQMAGTLGDGAKHLFEESKNFGVEVYTSAGRDELSAAARKSDIVIVLAHWKGPYLTLLPADIQVPVTELHAIVDTCIDKGILVEMIKIKLSKAPSVEKARDILAEGLNDAIDRWWEWVEFDEFVEDDAVSISVSRLFGVSLAREQIDAIFNEESLLPGSRLELEDGLWRPIDIAQCFGTDWEGICDFVCCTSAYLAEEIWTIHPKGLFRADTRLLYPKQIIPAVSELIERLLSDLESNVPGCISEDKSVLAQNYMTIAIECDQKYGGEI